MTAVIGGAGKANSNLADAASRNQARGIGGIALFEVGPQYSGDQPEDQALIAAGLRAEAAAPRHWAEASRRVDGFDAKADALAALAAAGAPVPSLRITRDAPGWYHPGRSGTLRLGPNALAHFGELHPGILREMDVNGPLAAFEVFLDAVPAPKAGKGKAGKGAARPLLELATLQPVHRDFAFVVDAGVAAEAVLRAVKGADKALVTDAALFDVFEGDAVGAGKKSLAVTVTLQPTEATLTDGEIEKISEKITEAVEKATGGVLRG